MHINIIATGFSGTGPDPPETERTVCFRMPGKTEKGGNHNGTDTKESV